MVTEYPPGLRAIVADACQKSTDIETSLRYALKKWRARPERDEFLCRLEEMAIRGMIHESRHETKTKISRAAGSFGGPSKLAPEFIEKAAASILDSWPIAGVPLGDLFGKDLSKYEADEREKARGSLLNADLLAAIAPAVSSEKRVRECLDGDTVFGLVQALRHGKRAYLPPPTVDVSSKVKAVISNGAGEIKSKRVGRKKFETVLS